MWWPYVQWYINHLTALCRDVGRELHLTVRAAPAKTLGALSEAFAGVTFLETSAFMKAMKRQRASLCPTGAVEWTRSPTAPDETVDELLQHNWRVVERSQIAAFYGLPDGQRTR